MTKYLESERFLVTSNNKEALKNYADNYDRIFGKKAEHVDGCIAPNCPGCDDGSPEAAFDGPFCVGCGVGLEVDPKACCCIECYRHDAACAKLCTEGAECDCGIG